MLEGFVVCLQRGRGLGEERFKLREELLASAGSFLPKEDRGLPLEQEENAQTLATAKPAVSAP